jgi:hypothetical protein
MAPEQFQGRVGPATDVYALGCVLFQMLTGETPFVGPTEQVMYGHLLAPPASLVERSQGRVPPALQGIIDQALAKNPEARFQTASALAQAFQQIISRNMSTVHPSMHIAPVQSEAHTQEVMPSLANTQMPQWPPEATMRRTSDSPAIAPPQWPVGISLTPAATEQVPGARFALPHSQKGAAWKVIQSWWILLTFTPFINWMAFLYIGFRAQRRRWVYWGLAYLAAFIPFAVTSKNDYFVGLYIITWLVGMVHGLVVLREFLLRLETRHRFRLQEEAMLRDRIAAEYNAGGRR